MEAWLDRGAGYIPWIESELAEAGLPLELSTLPLVESGYSNTAVSRAGAVGLWQLMPSTARSYGLRVDPILDERRDPYLATRAAIRHLRDLSDHFDSPYLAAAAYNAGAGRVREGLEQLPRATPSAKSFFRLADRSLLARETRNYVPQWIAASLIVRDPGRYGFHVGPGVAPPTDSLVVDRAVRLDSIAGLIGLSPGMLRRANPQFLRGVTPPGRRSVVRIPVAVPPGLAEKLAMIPDERLATLLRDEPDSRTRIAARRRSSGSPSAAAIRERSARSERSTGDGSGAEQAARARLHSTARRLAELQALTAQPPSAEAGHETPGATPMHRIRIRRGETLRGVAERFGVSEEALRRANALPASFPLRAGQLLLIP